LAKELEARTAGHDRPAQTPLRARAIFRVALLPLTFVGLLLLFFNKMAFSNLILARGDTFLYFYPYWQAAAEALRGGRVPLWNPDLFMGAPFLANSQAGFFYPLNWPVWLLLPTPYAVSASILIHLAIAGAGVYFAGRRTLALGPVAALFAAALFALGGYLTAQVEHVNQLQGLAWLPWFFVALAPWLAAPRSWRMGARAAVGVGVLFALQLLAGHTQSAFISGVAVVVWLIIHVLFGRATIDRPARMRDLLRAGLLLAAGVLLAAALAAVQLLPTLELAGQSSRQGGLPLNEVLSFSWHPLHLARALLPGYGPALFSEYVAYLPLTALALVVVGGWAWRKNPAVRPWLALVIVALVLAFGRFTLLYYFLGNLPGFDLFRVPARWLAVVALGAALLAGHGWQRLRDYANAKWQSPAERETARRDLIRPLAFAAAGLTLLVLWGYVAGFAAGIIPAGAEAPYEHPAPLALLGWAIEAVLAVLLLGVILTAPRERTRRATVDLLILALAALWLGSRGLPYNQLTAPAAYFDLRPPQARLIALANCAVPGQPCAAPPGRFLSLSDIFFDLGDMGEIDSIYGDQLPAAAVYDYVIAAKNKEVLSPNLSLSTGLPAIDGFDGGVLPLLSYSELMQLILPEGTTTTDGRLREHLDAAPDNRWLSLFNGRYLITDKTGDAWREGVFFDRQFPARPADEAIEVADVPPFEATELWLIAEGSLPDVAIQADGETWQLAPEPLTVPDLYHVVYPRPAVAGSITLQPCPADRADCGAQALTLVDGRDGAFQPLTLSPYRLIYSGDVKIYENLAAQPRAFVVQDWRWATDTAGAVAAMRSADFDPRLAGVVEGESRGMPVGGEGQGNVEIIEYTPELVRMRATTAGNGLLVLSDAHYPGWEATIDGQPTAIHRVDGLFRGVFLSPGEHVVEFSFRPRSFQSGLWLSAAGLGLLALTAAILIILTGRERRLDRY
jgi:hypothetical protein